MTTLPNRFQHLRELVSRIKAVLRRSSALSAEKSD